MIMKKNRSVLLQLKKAILNATQILCCDVPNFVKVKIDVFPIIYRYQLIKYLNYPLGIIICYSKLNIQLEYIMFFLYPGVRHGGLE